MNLKNKFNSRIFQGLCLLLSCLAIAYSAFRFAASDDLTPVSEQAQAEQRNEEKDESSKRAEGLLFRRLQLQDENGFIPPDGIRKARQHIELMKKERGKQSKNQREQLLEAGVFPESWSWMGPGNIGGRIRSILIHPTNPNNMWVGSVSGGIWRTTNGGASWSPVNDFMANLAVSTMVINPTNSNIMYAGTGEGFGNGDAILGSGVFRSSDGGANWSQLASTADWGSVNRLAISPGGNIILAARNDGVWRSINSGGSWTQTVTNRAYDVDFHPTDGNRAVFGGDFFSRYSEDGGQTWHTANFDSLTAGRVEVAYAPGSPNIVYASVNRNSGDLYRSADGGENFTLVNTGTMYLSNQGWYDNVIWVNPQDSNFVIVGGVHLWRSTNGGTTLVQISDGDSGSAHADHHSIVSHPSFNNGSNRTVFFGNDGGIYRASNVATVNLNSGWTELNNNLGITQFYGAAGNSTSGVIIGGTQDNGTLRYTGGTENWNTTFGADGGFCAADQTDANYFYGEKQNLGVIRSSNAGLSATQISEGITDRDFDDCRCNFIAPIALDPNNPQRLFGGGWSLWRANNARAATPTWTSIKPSQDGNPISAITIASGNSDFILVGHNDGDIWLTNNGTNVSPTWSQIDTSNLPNRFVTRLVIDTSRSPDWIYVTFGGFSSDNVYVSKNLGASWTNITGSGVSGLPSAPVRTLTFHPRNPSLLYIGTEVGIFTSGDGGANWDLPNGGPANVSVDELFWVGGDLIAATHGRGLYRASGGLYVDCNYNGVQVGTFSQPFKTVNAAINALTSYRPIWLKPCIYDEQVNTNKKFELRSLGGSASIGTP